MLKTILNLTITIKGDIFDIDLGSLRIHNGNKSYFLDIIQSEHEQYHDSIIISCELERDEISNIEIFGEDSSFDLTDNDLFKDNTYATVYVESQEEDMEIISMELVLVRGNDSKVIQCEKE